MNRTLEVDLIPLSDDSDRRIVAFILPLDAPLEIPHGSDHPCSFRRHKEGESSSVLEYLASDGEYDLYYDTRLAFFHTHAPLMIKGLDASRAVLQAWFPEEEMSASWKAATSQIEDARDHRTVVVAQCLVSAGSLEDDWDATITTLLDRAVANLNMFQNAYHAAMHRDTLIPTRLLTLETLQPFVPYASIAPVQGENRLGISMSVIENPASVRKIARVPSYAEANYVETAKYWRRTSSGAFSQLINIQREAMVARDDGNSIVASILMGVSAEIFLKTTAKLLLWEDGTSVDEAVSTLEKHDTISKIVNNILRPKLGGNSSDWDQGRAGTPLGKWREFIADLRNNSMHAGHVPTDEEVVLSIKSFSGLGEFVGRRVAAKISKYPVSAMLLLGTQGIEKLQASKSFDRHFSDLDPDPLERFDTWVKDVQTASPKK